MDPELANLDLDPPTQPSPLRRGLLPALIVNAIFFGGVALSLNWPIGESRNDARLSAAPPASAPNDTRAMGAAPAPATPPGDGAGATNAGPPSPMPQATPPSAPATSNVAPQAPASAPSRAAPAARRDPRAPRQGADSGASTSRLTTVSVQPSFDCAKARSPAERLICSDAELAQLDRDTGRLHARAKAAARDPAAFKRENDREWKQREAQCRDKACLLAWFAHRRAQLQHAVAQAR